MVNLRNDWLNILCNEHDVSFIIIQQSQVSQKTSHFMYFESFCFYHKVQLLNGFLPCFSVCINGCFPHAFPIFYGEFLNTLYSVLISFHSLLAEGQDGLISHRSLEVFHRPDWKYICSKQMPFHNM